MSSKSHAARGGVLPGAADRRRTGKAATLDKTKQGRDTTLAEWHQLNAAVARLRAGIMALVFGMTGAFVLFTATVWLLIRGGPNVGKHLSLLSNYFPGYSVTWGGAIVGLLYGALVGALAGWTIALLYNRIASRQTGRDV